MFGGNFAIRSFAFAQGQLLAISSNTALFSLYGTMYGGDGRTTFGLPDLRGRTPIGQGHGPGLPNYDFGQRGGTPTTTLGVANLPPHNHLASMNGATVGIPVNSAEGGEDEANPAGGILTNTGNDNFSSEAANSIYSGQRINVEGNITTSSTGNGQSFNNMQPFMTITYQVALQGIFPSRN